MRKLNLNKLSDKQFDILKTCYYGISHSTDELIEKASIEITEDMLEETCDVPQSIQSIEIKNTAISTELFINGKDCTDPNIEW